MATLGVKRKEIYADNYLPFIRHIEDTIVGMDGGGAMSVIQLEGSSFETADIRDINTLHDRLNVILRNIADDQLMIYTHVVRRIDDTYLEGSFKSNFGEWLDKTYEQQISNKKLYVNDIYLTLQIQPKMLLGRGFAALSAGAKKANKYNAEVSADTLRTLKDKTQQISGMLAQYNTRVLGLVKNEAGLYCSEPMSVFREIVSGVRGKLPLVNGHLGAAIYTDRLIFSREAFEIRHAGQQTVGGIFGIKEYPAETRPNMFDSLLSAPFRFVLTHSFKFINKAQGVQLMKFKRGQMLNANDPAASQADDLMDASDELMSSKFVVGDHHMSLTILADDGNTLKNNMTEAVTMLGEAGIVAAREDLGLESAFWAQLPGNNKHRVRPAVATSRNFASMSPLHNYPTGNKHGNYWGDAVSKFKTNAGGPYYFNFHIGDLGHTFICGPSGSGKTVIQTFLLSQLEKFDVKRILFDKDRGTEIFVRASGGVYLDLQVGEPTGCAPFKALDLNASTESFFITLLKSMLFDETIPFTASDTQRIENAVKGLYQIEQNLRSVSVIKELIGIETGGPEDIGVRLNRWCAEGSLAWVFENETDDLSFDADLIAFDITTFIDDGLVRNPIMLYLMQRIRQQITGQKICIFMDEFWKSLSDRSFMAFIKDTLKVIRKQNGFFVGGTQSLSDVIQSEIARTVIEQCKTRIYFPNDDADKQEMIEHFGLTEREYQIVRSELTVGQFLVKKNQNSVVCELDLQGQDDALAVLSGREETVRLMNNIRSQVGDNSEVWLPIFHQERVKNETF